MSTLNNQYNQAAAASRLWYIVDNPVTLQISNLSFGATSELCLIAPIRVRSFHLLATHEVLQFCIVLLDNLDYCTVLQYDGTGAPLLFPVLTSAKQAFYARQSTRTLQQYTKSSNSMHARTEHR